MNAIAYLMEAIAAEPTDPVVWLALADALEEQGQLQRADLTRRHRRLLSGERSEEMPVQAYLAAGVLPCTPRWTHPMGLVFRLIPAGSFWMGCVDLPPPEVTGIETSDERPRHAVTLTRSFWMSETTVYQKIFAEQMGQNPSRFKPARRRKRAELNRWPIDRVQWSQAVEFSQKLREADPVGLYRLPTEAEWEYACRAGTTSRFAYGERSDHQACNFDNQLRQPVPVDAYAPNAWGLYQIHGNMWEWCADWHGRTYYAESPQENPPGPEQGTYRITRGGGWGATEGRTTASARGIARPESRFDCIGFRVVREWEPDDADLIRRRFP